MEVKCELAKNSPKVESGSGDSISRQAAIDAILSVTGNSSVRELYEHVQEHGLSDMWSGGVNAAIDIIIALPSAQPEIVRCKDCKHWKDSDGVYRRGIGAESKCPVNIRAVYEGNFYCADAERRTDE